MRQVFVTEARCPFCHQALAPVATERIVVPAGWSRSQRLILAAALIGMSGTGCDDGAEARPAATPQQAGTGGNPGSPPLADAGIPSPAPAYGAPPLPFPVPPGPVDPSQADDAGVDDPDAGVDEPDAG